MPGDLQRIDRIDLIPRRDQRLHPRAAVGLDTDHHVCGILIIAEVLADQRMQSGDPGDPFRQRGPTQPPACLVLHLDVVVVLGPVVSDEQHSSSPRP